MTSIDRRMLLTRGAIGGAALTVVAASHAFANVGENTATGAGELAALVKRYFAEIDAFNGFVITDNRGDEEANAMAEATYEATRERMIGVPARSAEDALAAMDWLTKEGVDFETELGDDGPHEQVVTSLVDAIRNYIVSTAGRQV